jgi:GNAT superfamily N-acetyltransferase
MPADIAAVRKNGYMRLADDGGIEIREGGVADVEAMAGIQLASALSGFAHIFPEEIPKPTQELLETDWLQIVRDPGMHAVIAEISGTPGGAVAFGTGPSGCVLRKLYVHPGKWASGVGSILHDHAVAGLRAMGCTTAHLWVLERNIIARRMYEHRGWKLTHSTCSLWPGSGILELCYTLELVPTRL